MLFIWLIAIRLDQPPRATRESNFGRVITKCRWCVSLFELAAKITDSQPKTARHADGQKTQDRKEG